MTNYIMLGFTIVQSIATLILLAIELSRQKPKQKHIKIAMACKHRPKHHKPHTKYRRGL